MWMLTQFGHLDLVAACSSGLPILYVTIDFAAWDLDNASRGIFSRSKCVG